MKEQWPISYLSRFTTFTRDTKSKRHFQAHLKRHIDSGGLKHNRKVKILDIMSANGFAGNVAAQYLTSLGYQVEVTNLDKSEEISRHVRKIKKYPSSFVSGDVRNMRMFTDSYFDIIVCRYGFNNLEKQDWLPAINESLRVLKNQGLFLLQDHFIPGPTFGALVNDAEQYLAKLEGKINVPYIYTTEAMNALLDGIPEVESRIKSGYGLIVNIWQRLKAKSEILKDFDQAKYKIKEFYRKVCLEKYQLFIVDEEEYIHVYNITYAIIKR